MQQLYTLLPFQTLSQSRALAWNSWKHEGRLAGHSVLDGRVKSMQGEFMAVMAYSSVQSVMVGLVGCLVGIGG